MLQQENNQYSWFWLAGDITGKADVASYSLPVGYNTSVAPAGRGYHASAADENGFWIFGGRGFSRPTWDQIGILFFSVRFTFSNILCSRYVRHVVYQARYDFSFTMK
jgi:hypothetical protein